MNKSDSSPIPARVLGIPLVESYEKLSVGYGEVVQVEFDHW